MRFRSLQASILILASFQITSCQPGTWTNWSQRLVGTYLSYNTPTNEEQIVSLVRQAAANNQTISVVGHGHSFSNIVPINGQKDGHMIDLSLMNDFVRMDESSITVQAGMYVGSLVLLLTQNGRSLPNNGGPQINTVAGTVNTNTHGSGATTGLSGFVKGVRTVTGAGDILEIDESDPRLPAFMEGVGVMGIFTEVTLATIPLHQVRQYKREISVYEYIELLPQLRGNYDDLFTFYFPRLDPGELTTYEPSTDPPSPGGCTVACNLTSCVDYGNQCVGGCEGVIPPLSNSECFVPDTLAIDFLMDWVKVLEDLADLLPQLSQSSSGLRFVKADSIFVSPMYDVDAAALDFAWQSPSSDVEIIFRDAFVEHCWNYRARPHWGKENYYSLEQLHSIYPQLDNFRGIRRTLDPDGVFLKNDFIRSIFE